MVPGRASIRILRRLSPLRVLGLSLALFLLLPLAPGLSGPASLPSPAVAPAAAAALPTPIHHVIVIMMENQERKDVLANGSFERYLAGRYAQEGQFYSPMHFSLPNYLAVTSGYLTNLFAPITQPNVGTLAASAGRTWKEYEESMPTPCDLSTANQTNGYDYWHNPFAMYNSMIRNASLCAHHMVNFTRWSSDVAHQTVPNYALIVPNTTHDGHDTGIAVGDQWLSGFLSPFINSTLFRTSAVFVAYDEGVTNLSANGSASGGGHIYLTMASPFAKRGYTGTANHTSLDLLTTTEWLLGLGRTGTNDNWTRHVPLSDLFAFPTTVSGSVTSAKGVPLANATVGNHVGAHTVTNATGGFTLPLTPGNWTLYAFAPGFGHGNVSVNVSAAPIGGLVITVRPNH